MAPHIAFLIPHLGGGGAERLTVDLVNGFAARGARVDLVLMEQSGVFLPMLSPDVRIFELGAKRLRNVPLRLRRYLKAEQPDALLASMWPLTTVAMAATIGLAKRPRMVLADHCALLEQYADDRVTIASLHGSIRASYGFADAVVGVSHGVAGELARLGGLDQAKVTTIYNPIPPPLRSGTIVDWGDDPGKRILGVGSFKQQKNFPLLLRAFARIAPEQHCTLAIAGDGQERPALEAMIAELGLQDRVLLPGFTATPGDWYASADLFVLSSEYEGFALVLGEAMHCGLPIVATDCPYGPDEILGNGRWGQLVPRGDAAAMAEAMRSALATPANQAAQRTRAEEFSVERAVDAYWQVLVKP